MILGINLLPSYNFSVIAKSINTLYSISLFRIYILTASRLKSEFLQLALNKQNERTVQCPICSYGLDVALLLSVDHLYGA